MVVKKKKKPFVFSDYIWDTKPLTEEEFNKLMSHDNDEMSINDVDFDDDNDEDDDD